MACSFLTITVNGFIRQETLISHATLNAPGLPLYKKKLLPGQSRRQQGGIFQLWRPKFSSNPVTSTSWRSDVDGRGVALVGTEKFMNQAPWSILYQQIKKTNGNIETSSNRDSVSEFDDVLAVIYFSH